MKEAMALPTHGLASSDHVVYALCNEQAFPVKAVQYENVSDSETNAPTERRETFSTKLGH